MTTNTPWVVEYIAVPLPSSQDYWCMQRLHRSYVHMPHNLWTKTNEKHEKTAVIVSSNYTSQSFKTRSKNPEGFDSMTFWQFQVQRPRHLSPRWELSSGWWILCSPSAASPSGRCGGKLWRPRVSWGTQRCPVAFRDIQLACDMAQANCNVGDDWADMGLLLQAHDGDRH
jgi:hypothetical protein